MVQAVAHSSSQMQLPAENVPQWLESISDGHSEAELEKINALDEVIIRGNQMIFKAKSLGQADQIG